MKGSTIVRRRPGLFWTWVALLAAGTAFVIWASYRQVAWEPVPAAVDWSRITAAPNLEPILGHEVRILFVTVTEVTSDTVFWGTAPGGKTVLVVHAQGMPRGSLQPGQILDVTGTVRAAPGWEQARQLWNFDPALRSRFEEQKLYLAADRVNVLEEQK